MECAQVTEEQRLWTETQIQKAKHNAWPSCLASVYLTQYVGADCDGVRHFVGSEMCIRDRSYGEDVNNAFDLSSSVEVIRAKKTRCQVSKIQPVICTLCFPQLQDHVERT